VNFMTNHDFFSSNPPDITAKLQGKHIFIAGAGGLGSNTAMLLAKAGADLFTIIDFDKIEPSNINRQFFFRDQVGMVKIEALKENLLRINPEIDLKVQNLRLTPKKLQRCYP
jgi:sulfur carrier protein ThiS adenylyltransferase